MDSVGPTLKRRRLHQPSSSARGGGDVESALANYLLMQLAWGIFSAPQVQKIAELALVDLRMFADGKTSLIDLQALGKAGRSGAHQNNVHRDIMTTVREHPKMKPTVCLVPFKEPLGEALTSMMLPHELFSVMYHEYPKSFAKNILPSDADVQQFWNDVQDHPQLVGHPVKSKPQYKSKAVPIAMHGDEVPVVGIGKVWAKSFLTFSWYSMLGARTITKTTDLMNWIWGFFERFNLDGESGTCDIFFQILEWSLAALYDGKWPSKDWRGRVNLGYDNLFMLFMRSVFLMR